MIANVNGAPVKLRDVGRVEDGTKEQRSFSRLNGVPTVTLESAASQGPTQSRSSTAQSNLPRVAAQLPSDVKLDVIRDQSRYIDAALHEIKTHLILGSILACLVVLLFMRIWRSTLIAAVAIPCSVISTFGMMRALNFTLNSVTMLALVLMVGVVIDDAIVVLENIFRFVEEKKMTPLEAAREATRRSASRYRDHAVAGRHLPAGVFHVEHLGPLSVPVRHHCGGRDPGQPAGLFHADAHDERARCFAPATRGRPRAARSRRGFYRLIDVLTRACWRLR